MSRPFVRIILAFAVLVLLACIGFLAPIDFAVALAFGWLVYLYRVLPEVRTNGWGVATAVACLVPLAVGTQVFLSWFFRTAEGEKVVDQLDRRWKWRWTGWLIAGVVLMFVAGLAAGGVAHQVGWLMNSPEPLVQSQVDARSAAYRAQSANNLKMMGVALRDDHEKHGTFLPGATFDRVGRPLHGWQAMILPDLEQKPLFDRIDFDVPWDDPRNAEAFRTEVMVFQRPGIDEKKDPAGYALSHYAGNAHLLGGDRRWSRTDVTDGAENTIMAGEALDHFKPWGDPTNRRDPALGVNRSADGFGCPRSPGANFLFVDGSVRFIKETVHPRVVEALGTPRGGERVAPEQY